jgi:hypothetical protein
MVMRALRVWVLCCLVLLPAGCGPRSVNVSGTVTFKDKPLTAGTITFYDATNKPRSAQIEANGAYAVKDVATGRARITVIAPMDIKFPGMAVGGMPGAPGDPKPAAGSGVTLPAKYNDPDQSGLTCDVKSPDQKHDVKLD